MDGQVEGMRVFRSSVMFAQDVAVEIPIDDSGTMEFAESLDDEDAQPQDDDSWFVGWDSKLSRAWRVRADDAEQKKRIHNGAGGATYGAGS